MQPVKQSNNIANIFQSKQTRHIRFSSKSLNIKALPHKWVETGKIRVGYGRRLTGLLYRAEDPQTVDGHLNSLQQ